MTTTTATTTAERAALAPDRADRAAERARRRRRRMAAAPLPTTWATDDDARAWAADHLGPDALARLHDMARTVAARCRGVYGTDADTLRADALAAMLDNDPRGLADLAAGRPDGWARARMTLRSVAGHAMRRATMADDHGQRAEVAAALAAEQSRAERAAALLVAGSTVDPAEVVALAADALAGQGASADDAAVARVAAVVAALAADGLATRLDRDEARGRVYRADRYAAAVGSADSTTTTADRLAEAHKVRPWRQIREATTGGPAWNGRGAVRIVREAPLAAMVGADDGGPTLDTLTRRGGTDVDPRETAAALADLMAALAAAYVPAGQAGTLAADVRAAAVKLEGLTGAGILRRSAALARQATAARAGAERAAERERAAVTATGEVDADARRAAKRERAELVRLAEASAAGSLALVGAYGASRGGRAAATAADLGARARHLRAMAARLADEDADAAVMARRYADRAEVAAERAAAAVRAGRAVAAGHGAAGRTLPGIALADLVAAATDCQRARKQSGGQRDTVGASVVDWHALAAALDLPVTDPAVKALRTAVRAAATDGRAAAAADRATYHGRAAVWAGPVVDA